MDWGVWLFFFGAFGDEVGLLDDEGGVEEVEGLEGGGGDGAFGADLAAVGEVEGGEDLVIDAAHALLVEHAAPGGGAVVIDDLPLGVGEFFVVDAEAATAEGGVEFSGGLEDAIADDFGFDAARWEAPEEGGVGVFLEGEAVGMTGAAEGIRGDEEADHGLYGPVVLDEFRGEVVEEFGV